AQVAALFRLDGRVAVVTGGAGLYGRPIARALAEAGATVIIASRDEAKCDAYAAELRAAGLAAHGAALDQGSRGAVETFAYTVLERHGRVDVLVNNAVRRSPTHYTEASPEEWEDIL